MGSSYSTGILYNLTPEHLARLQRQFQRLARGHGSATIADLQKLPELAGNPLIPRIFQLIDTDGDGRLNMDEFIAAVRRFVTLWDDDALYEFAFEVYDQDGDGLISAEELYELLHSVLGYNYSDHQLQQVVQATMQQHARTQEWMLTPQEFRQLADAEELRSKLNIRL